MFRSTTFCLLLVGFAARLQAEDHAARFSKQSYIEVQNSARELDLNADFTIELWAKWTESDRYDVFAGDEAWPGMSPQVDVSDNRGWTLRKGRADGHDTIEFNVGADKAKDGWLSVKAVLPERSQDWTHLSVCRRNDSLVLYVDGKRLAVESVKGKTLLKSPSPMYLGVRKNSIGDRAFHGYIRGFRVSKRARYTQNFASSKLLKLKSDDDTLVLYNFDKVSETQVNDTSGHGRHGVFEGVELVPLKK